MNLSCQSEQVTFTVELEDASLVALLGQGLQCIRHGHYTEGAAFFALAREQLSSDCGCIASILDALMQSSTNYRYAQQALHDASKHFAETDSAQQAQMEVLEKLLPTLMQKTVSVPHALAQLPNSSQDHQPSQLLQTPIVNCIDYQALAVASMNETPSRSLPQERLKPGEQRIVAVEHIVERRHRDRLGAMGAQKTAERVELRRWAVQRNHFR